MKPITIPNISIPTIGIPTVGIPSVGFPSASGGGGLSWPAGMKEHIKAIYDPKKQGITNFDVIESYTEDFTTWRYSDSRGTAAVTPNKITITESFDTTNIVEDVEEPYSDISIYVTGVSEDVPLVVRDITGNKAIITKDGKYDFSKNSRFMGFAINKILSNINVVISLLPTSILKDLSGNGNHAYLYGGKGKLNSGMGVYQIDFTTYSKTSVVADVSHNTVKVVPAANNYLFVRYATTEMPAYTVNVQNLGNNVLTYQYATENGRREITLTEGINEIPESIKAENPYQVGFYVSAGTGEITITQIPDYPNQLCYDGKMYAVCYDFPILTDYTVMADRTWFEKEEYSAFISNSLGGMEDPSNGAFSVELKSLNSFTTISFGSMTSIGIPEKGITYQTKQSYNGNSINVGTKESNDILILGSRYFYKNNNTPGNTWTGCHGAIIVADHSFTEEEINWLKDNWEKI